MRKARILLILGIWITILPRLGFPYSWKDILFTITGLGLIYFSYMLYKESKINEIKEEIFDNFRENSDFSENDVRDEIETVIEKIEIENHIKPHRKKI